MELVIKLNDETYKEVIDRTEFDTLVLGIKLIEAVQNGTLLPKGHGRLIDATDLLKMTESYKSELGRLKADPFVKSGIETVESFIKEMQTIIEAESEDKE